MKHGEPARRAMHVLLDLLEAEGVDRVFGIPGGPIIPLYEALYERGTISPVLAKHEEGAAFMADGYARATGRVGVCCTTTGPGATNAVTGLAVAHADQVPVLLLTAQVPTHQFGMGAFQESSPETIDLVSLFKPVTKWSAMVPHPSRLGASVRAALRAMTSGRPGPAHLSIPLDYMSATLREPAPGPRPPRSAAVDLGAVRSAAARLLAARAPAILAGHGVNSARAWDGLRALAETLRVPVATTFKAKGCLPEDHPLSLGVLGPSGDPGVREFILGSGTDLLLVVGSSLGEVSSCGFDPRLGEKRLIQVDVDGTAIGRNYPADAVVGDAAAVLGELACETRRLLRGARRRAPVLPARAPVRPPEPAEGALDPRAVLAELRAALPRDAAVFVDNGSIRSWMGRWFPVLEPDSFFVNMGMASMGYAVAASIGAQLARPERAVVCLAGDAAFAMNGLEVHTAVEAGAPVIWVVLNNGGHGMIYHGERALYGGKFTSSIFGRVIDVAGISSALGADSYRVQRPGELSLALSRARALRRPAVIDVLTALGDAPPMGARVGTIRRELAAA